MLTQILHHSQKASFSRFDDRLAPAELKVMPSATGCKRAHKGKSTEMD